MSAKWNSWSCMVFAISAAFTSAAAVARTLAEEQVAAAQKQPARPIRLVSLDRDLLADNDAMLNNGTFAEVHGLRAWPRGLESAGGHIVNMRTRRPDHGAATTAVRRLSTYQPARVDARSPIQLLVRGEQKGYSDPKSGGGAGREGGKDPDKGDRHAGYHPMECASRDGCPYDDHGGDVQCIGSNRVRLSEGGSSGWVVYHVEIDDNYVREGSLEIGVEFCDWAWWPWINGPDIYVRDFASAEWDNLCMGCGNHDDYVLHWYTPPDSSNRYVNENCEVWIKVYACNDCDTVVDHVEVCYEGANEDIYGYIPYGRDDCEDDPFDGLDVWIDADVGEYWENVTVEVTGEGILYDPDDYEVDRATTTWTITGWEIEYGIIPLSACGGLDGTYRVEINLYDECGQSEFSFEFYVDLFPEPSQGLPDLIIESSSRDPADDVQPGDYIHLIATIRNDGLSQTTSVFRIQWYISENETVNESDEPWGYDDVYIALDPGDTYTSDGYAPWPDLPPDHTYWIAVKADRFDDIEESDETNNWGDTFPITQGSADEYWPDLIIQDSSRSPAADVQPGDLIDLWSVVKNQGNGDTTWRFNLTWYISENANMDTSEDWWWVRWEIPCCLAPGEATERSGSFPWPDFPPYNTYGHTYYIAVIADDTGLVSESDENNNWGEVFAVTLGPEPEDWPDLVIESSSCSALEGSLPGRPFNLTFTVRNQGDDEASWSFWTTWFISTNAEMDPTEDFEWAYGLVPCCLGAGEAAYGDWEVPWPNVDGYNTPGATYYVGVMADDTGLVTESNENNNWSEVYEITLDLALGNLIGTVFDNLGDPVDDAHVTLQGYSSQDTGPDGQFSFTGVPAGDYTLTASKLGYYDGFDSVTIEAGCTTEATIYLVPDDGGADPVVGAVSAGYCGPGTHVYYLDGVYLMETFTAVVAWNGHPEGAVQFITPYGTYDGNGSGGTWTKTFNMGNDFGPGGTLTVVAVAGDEAESDPYPVNCKVISPPPGILPILLQAELGNTLRYVTPRISEDPSGVEQGVEEGQDGIPEDLPLFGGEAFKFIGMFDVSVEINGDGSASGPSVDPDLPGDEGKTKLAGYEFAPSLSGQVGWQFYENPDHWVSTGHVQFGATIGVDVPPTPYYIIFMAGPIPIPLYFRGHIDIGLEAALDITGWDNPGEATFNGSLILDPFPYAEAMVGVGAADVAAIEGYLGGGARMRLNYPPIPPDPVLEQLQVYLTGGVRIVVWIFTYEWPALNYTWDLYSGRYVADPGRRIMRIMPRDYLRRDGGYAVFVINEKRGSRDVITEEIPMQLNIFGQSTPDLAAIGDDLLAVWIYDDPARSPTNRTQVVFSRGRFTGDPNDPWTWDDPEAVADDETADFRPQIAALPNGDALLAWENIKEVLIEPDEPNDPCIDACEGDPNYAECLLRCKLEEMKNKTEIAVARYDAATGMWDSSAMPAENNITDNDYLDRSPRVVAAADGSAMLTWVSNAANHETGDPNNPNDIHFVTYDGVDWSTPADVALGVPSIIRSDMAYDGTQAVLAFIGDTDGDAQTSEDRELFAIEYDGSTWGSVMQLTMDAVEDANPKAVYDSYGELLIVWYRAGDLVMATDLDDFLFDTVVELQSDASSGVADFSLATGFTGQIALVWQDVTDEQAVDMWRAMYDPALQLWSNPQRLTSDDSMEHAISPVYDASGNLVAVYDKVQTVYETRIVVVNGEEIEVEVPTPGQTDLYLLRHTVTGDLAIQAEDIVVTPPNPSIGEVVTITAKVRNLGDVAGVDVDVAFYDGNPSDGGVLIDLPVIPGLLIGGDQAEASVQWLVPEAPDTHDIYIVVDPYPFEQEDGNRENNTAILAGGMKPDLFVDSILVQEAGPDTRILTVRVANDSGWAVSDVEVTLRRGAVDGELLTTLTVPEPIAPGTHHDVSWAWEDFGVCGGTVSLYAIVDESNAVEEFDETNNTRMALAQLSESFTPFDLDYDGIVTIIGDVEPFVDCVYFSDCYCPEPGCVCPGDCNGDGFLSIIGDVECFVDCVYFGDCGDGRSGGKAGPDGRSPGTFTIGGAVYTDLVSPMMSGLERVTIEAIRVAAPTGKVPPAAAHPAELAAELAQTPDDYVERFTATTASMGIWRIDDLPAGTYVVRAIAPGYAFEHVRGGTPTGRDSVRIIVNQDNRGPNGSVQFLAAE